MKEVDLKGTSFEDLMDEWRVADWNDIDGLLANIDAELFDHGLELVVGDFGSDDYLIKIEPRQNNKKESSDPVETAIDKIVES